MSKRKYLGWFLVSISIISIFSIIGLAVGHDELIKFIFIFSVVGLIVGSFIYGLELIKES